MSILKRCEDCEGLIPEKRLRAVSNARRCVPCQTRYDLDPIEALGRGLLEKGMAVVSEADGDDLRAVLHGR